VFGKVRVWFCDILLFIIDAKGFLNNSFQADNFRVMTYSYYSRLKCVIVTSSIFGGTGVLRRFYCRILLYICPRGA